MSSISIPRRPSSSIPNRRRTSSSFSSASQRSRYRSGSSPSIETRSFLDGLSEGEEFGEGGDDGEEEWEGSQSRSEFVRGSSLGSSLGEPYGATSKGRRKKDEPMKPTTVILYVIIFYIIWQILTRSTETEILSHLAPSSPHHYHLSSSLPESSGSNSHAYQPYLFPHIPSPLPPTSSPNGSSTPSPGVFRWTLGLAMYPFYLVLRLLSLFTPVIIAALNLIFQVISTVLLPFTFPGRILLGAFVYTPWMWCRAVGRVMYPVYVFVGGMIGVGCVMGLGAGWAGRRVLDYVTGKSRSGRKSGEGQGKNRREMDGSYKSHNSATTRSSRHSNMKRTSMDASEYQSGKSRPNSHSHIFHSIRQPESTLPIRRESININRRTSHSHSKSGTQRRSSRSSMSSSNSSVESHPPNPRTPNTTLSHRKTSGSGSGRDPTRYRSRPDLSVFPDDSISVSRQGVDAVRSDSNGVRSKSVKNGMDARKSSGSEYDTQANRGGRREEAIGTRRRGVRYEGEG